MEGGAIRTRGLICAGGEATRLQELTRITNKHLLPVGRWPMVYYPLQLMQLLGIRDVLLVTGQAHAGDFIDLLGDGRVRERDGDGLLFELGPHVQGADRAGGIAQVVAWPSPSPRGRASWSASATTSSSTPRRGCRVLGLGSDGALIFVKDVPDRSASAWSYTVRTAVSRTWSRRPASSTRATTRRPSSDAVVGLYCYPSDVFEIIRGLAPSSRGELEITDVNRSYAEQGRLRSAQVSGWWHDAGTHEALGQIGNLIDDTGVNKPA